MISFLFFLFCIEPLPNLLLVEHFLTTSGLTMLDSNLFLLKRTLKILICLSLSFNKIYIWFSKCSWHRVPKIPGISKMIRVINVCFVMLMKWLLDLTEVQELVSCQEHHNHLIRGLKLSVPPPHDLRGGKWGWRMNQLPIANDLINCAYVMKLPQNPQKLGFGVLPGW